VGGGTWTNKQQASTRDEKTNAPPRCCFMRVLSLVHSVLHEEEKLCLYYQFTTLATLKKTLAGTACSCGVVFFISTRLMG
jgi:hypothetical protein